MSGFIIREEVSNGKGPLMYNYPNTKYSGGNFLQYTNPMCNSSGTLGKGKYL